MSQVNYLIHAAGCSECEGIARRVADASDGLLQARPSYDEVVQRARRAGTSIPQGEPFLLTEADGRFRVRRRGRMSRFLFRELGPRRAMTVMRALDADRGGNDRRTFLRLGVGGALALVGVGFGVAAPAAAANSVSPMSPKALAAVQARASADAGFKQVLQRAGKDGFDLSDTVYQGYQLDGGEQLLIGFLSSRSATENEARAVMYHRSPGGVWESGFSDSTRQGYEAAMGALGSYKGPKDFAACVLAVSGFQCGAHIAFCVNLRVWQLVLACLVARCGPAVVRAAWQCRGRL